VPTKILLDLVISPTVVMLGLENTSIIIWKMKSAENWEPLWIWCSHSSDYEEHYLVGDDIACSLLGLPWKWWQYIPPKHQCLLPDYMVSHQRRTYSSAENQLCAIRTFGLIGLFQQNSVWISCFWMPSATYPLSTAWWLRKIMTCKQHPCYQLQKFSLCLTN
jgi:hypothetical protein